jgi:hypothetical protein
MTRLLGIALLLYILWLAVGNFMQKLRAVTSSGALRPEPQARPAVMETLLPCAVCGTYVPASRALKAGEEVFCTEGCRGQKAGVARSRVPFEASPPAPLPGEEG